MCKLEILDKNADRLAILYSNIIPRKNEWIYIHDEQPVLVKEVGYHQSGDSLNVLIWTEYPQNEENDNN